MEQEQQLFGFRKRKNLEWDLNDWKWDGDLFLARPLDPASVVSSNSRGRQFIPIPAAGNSSNSSPSSSDDLNAEPEIGRGGVRDLDRKRIVAVHEDNNEEIGTLSLKLGGSSSAVGQSPAGSSEKNIKSAGGSSNRAGCQVENCAADLSGAKDYHRRHKVCPMHARAPEAMVGNVVQRFCQQCSRFHGLQEFDEGKRSCRRRLAGHNKRRRKTQPDPIAAVQSINEEQASSYILVNLLKMLSDAHANNRSEPNVDHDLVAQLTRNLASQSGSSAVNDVSAIAHEYQKLLNGKLSVGNPGKISPVLSATPPGPSDRLHGTPAPSMPQKSNHVDSGRKGYIEAASNQKSEGSPSKDGHPVHSEAEVSAAAKTKLNDFDLNDIYIDSDDGAEDLERSAVTGTGSPDFPSWGQRHSQQSSPPQLSGNSDTASALSPSSSSSETQSRTGHIVFKLFGKDPNDFPDTLRGQILDWLAHSPTDIEGYIRPGCVILTIYLRLADSVWEELLSNFGFSLSRFMDITDDSFWQTGWIYARVQNQVAFFHNGEVVVEASLQSENSHCSRVFSVSPIAVPMSEPAEFQIRGSNLSRSTTRLACALEGKYLALESHQELESDSDELSDDDKIECLNLSCSIPSVTGRGFIEVDDLGLGGSFFPFIVADKDVCSEIQTLESILELGDSDEENGRQEAKHQAMDFIHELGWLFHRSQSKYRLGHQNPNTDTFSFKRFRLLMEFSMDHDWCAVVRKLLDIFLEETVGSGEFPSLDLALSEMGLLHRAVRRNSRPLVELLLRYSPRMEGSGSNYELPSSEDSQSYLFRPDAKGPAGLTPLHIAAGKDGSEDVLDALIDDPGKVGIEAWKNSQDSTGSTPEDYARLRGHYAYIHLVQRKAGRKAPPGSVVLDIPEDTNPPSTTNSKRITDAILSFRIMGALPRNNTATTSSNCNLCERKVTYGAAGRSMAYRPAMLSMVAVAAVCVCVALLFRGLPDVFGPFRWESLDYGSI